MRLYIAIILCIKTSTASALAPKAAPPNNRSLLNLLHCLSLSRSSLEAQLKLKQISPINFVLCNLVMSQVQGVVLIRRMRWLLLLLRGSRYI